MLFFEFFFKQNTADEVRMSDWSSDVCSSDLDVEMEFKRMQVALRNVRQHSDNWALGRHRVLDIAIAPTVNPNAFTSFFLSALEQVPSVGIKVRALQPSEDAAAVLSGK